MSNWQPIETAPLNTPVLIAAWQIDNPTKRMVCVAECEIYRHNHLSIISTDGDIKIWSAIGSSGYENERDFISPPTHWKPLDPPPEETTGDSNAD